VPEGSELLRTSYMATHTDDQLDRVLDVFEQVGKEMGLI
jgi:8-amino-7-oxononanoate synthase